jgi:FtsZ-interacting cell division protein YlmF
MDIESRSKYIFDKLKGNHENWTDEQNIITPFESGSEIFGHSKMFKYIFREDITKHDALYDFLRIIDLYNASGLSSNEFFNNILQQVKDDTSNYESGASYHLLNNIARNVNINFEETLQKAKQYELPTLNQLLESISSSQDIFSSWKMLKKYNELCSILNKSEVLEQLKGLKETGGSIDLHNYIETLAFHPNIAMAKVIQFWKNPEEFLEINDTLTPDDVHNRKKPSNYVDIPNLDLSAKELRDALVEGYYDHLQVFEPLEINYKILTEGKYKDKELNELISIAVGKRSERIKGEAKNPDKLFSEFQKLFKKNGINLTEYLRDTAVDKKQQEDVVNSIKKQIMDLVYDKNIGLKDDRKFEEYRAVINLKSDPNGVVAGNDTACCMPFGSGKNNIYTFNPICSLFTVRRLVSVDENGKKQWKTVAQSVLTENIDIEKNISGVIDKLNQSDVHMHDIVDDQALLDKPGVITCDNIEVEHNFESKAGSFNILKHIYLDYFKEYIKRFAKTHNLDENRVIVGLGSTDANISYDRIENTYAPKAPVGYSDNLHNKAMLLDLSKYQGSNMFASRDVRIQEKKAKIKEQEQIDLPKGVTELTFKDSIPVAYIEGKAYKDNQKLIEYLHNMENALIAKDVYNTYKGKPNMSFKYTGSDRKMHGYILAYEGKMDKEDKDSKDIVYVSDLASDGNLRAGGSLILAFAEAYKKHHIDKNNIIPILAQFREKTSYQIIAKQLEKLTKDTGIEFETEELDSYKVGDDTMHEVIIRKKK